MRKISYSFIYLVLFAVIALASDRSLQIDNNVAMRMHKMALEANPKRQIEPALHIWPEEQQAAPQQYVLPKIERSLENSTQVLVDSSRNGFGWLNQSIRSVDHFKGNDASGTPVDFVLLAYRQFLLSNAATGILGASTINVESGLAGANVYRYVELNQDLGPFPPADPYNSIGGRYPGVVALERPFIHFNQYISGDANSTPAISSPYVITDWGTYGDFGGLWTPSYAMDQGYSHHDSPGGNRLWNGPVAIVKDASGTFHYCGVFANWYLDDEGQDNDHAILNASSLDPTSSWTIDTTPELIDPTVNTFVSPSLSMNSHGFGVIASAGHVGYHEGTSYLYAELRIIFQTTNDFGATWSEARQVEWDELGIPTMITPDDSVLYLTPDSTVAVYDSAAFVGTNFDMDVIVSEDDDIYIGFNVLWGRPATDGWFPHYLHSGPHVAVSNDKGASFQAHRIAINNGFFEGDSIIPGMSSVFFDSEIDLSLDDAGNLYATWLDRPNNPVELAEVPRYSATAGSDYKTDVFTARSLDGGKTWNWPVNATDSPGIDEYELKVVRNANSANNGTIYYAYCTVNPNEPINPQAGEEDTYLYRTNRVWVGETNNYPEPGTNIEADRSPAVSSFVLQQNYPNPFNPSTRIEFTPRQSGKAVISVYDISGQKIKDIFNGLVQGGRTYGIDFNADNLAAGVYFYRLTMPRANEVRKMVLIK